MGQIEENVGKPTDFFCGTYVVDFKPSARSSILVIVRFQYLLRLINALNICLLNSTFRLSLEVSEWPLYLLHYTWEEDVINTASLFLTVKNPLCQWMYPLVI